MHESCLFLEIATVALSRKPVNTIDLDFLNEFIHKFEKLEMGREVDGVVFTSVSQLLCLLSIFKLVCLQGM